MRIRGTPFFTVFERFDKSSLILVMPTREDRSNAVFFMLKLGGGTGLVVHVYETEEMPF